MIIAEASRLDMPEIAEVDAYAPLAWSESSWRSQLDVPDSYTVVAHDTAGDVLGVAAFHHAGDFVDLLRVAVRPMVRNQGVGRALVENGIQWATLNEAARMLLEVAVDNKPALGLYRSLGFTDMSVRDDYYGQGMSALVMEKHLVSIEEWELIGAPGE